MDAPPQAPPRFIPTDYDIVHRYLLPRVSDLPLPADNRFMERPMSEINPENLPAEHPLPPGQRSYFVFSRREISGGRCRRKFEFGTWRRNGENVDFPNENGVIIARRRRFSFVRNDGMKTNWNMMEFVTTAPVQNPTPAQENDRMVAYEIYHGRRHGVVE